MMTRHWNCQNLIESVSSIYCVRLHIMSILHSVSTYRTRYRRPYDSNFREIGWKQDQSSITSTQGQVVYARVAVRFPPSIRIYHTV